MKIYRHTIYMIKINTDPGMFTISDITIVHTLRIVYKQIQTNTVTLF